MKLVIVSDAHLGKDRIGKANISPEKWDRPLHEAIRYAIDEDVDFFLFAGDEFESRHPAPSTIMRLVSALNELEDAGIPYLIVGGNHTIGAGADYTSSLAPLTMMGRDSIVEGVIRKVRMDSVRTVERKALNVVALPWIRPVDYANPEQQLTIDEEIGLIRELALDKLDSVFVGMAGEKPVPTVVLGHVMTSTGTVNADAPPAFLGKDIPLPLKVLESYGVPVVLGHIHQAVGPYVGSTQPTDFSDTGEKSFTVLEWNEDAGISPLILQSRERIPYTTSLKVADIRIDENWSMMPASETPDIVRITMAEGANDPWEIRKAFESNCTIESITVERERHVTARVDTEEALVAMNPLDAAEIWLESGGEGHDKTEAMKRFKMLVEAAE